MAANDPNIDENSYSIKNAYVIFCFCYQIGTFTSRSLLEMMKTSRIGILTFLQIINFAFGFSNSYWFYLKNQYALFAWMVFIGLLKVRNNLVAVFKLFGKKVDKSRLGKAKIPYFRLEVITCDHFIQRGIKQMSLQRI